jgi:hypothetical protein
LLLFWSPLVDQGLCFLSMISRTSWAHEHSLIGPGRGSKQTESGPLFFPLPTEHGGKRERALGVSLFFVA